MNRKDYWEIMAMREKYDSLIQAEMDLRILINTLERTRKHHCAPGGPLEDYKESIMETAEKAKALVYDCNELEKVLNDEIENICGVDWDQEDGDE